MFWSACFIEHSDMLRNNVLKNKNQELLIDRHSSYHKCIRNININININKEVCSIEIITLSILLVTTFAR